MVTNKTLVFEVLSFANKIYKVQVHSNTHRL